MGNGSSNPVKNMDKRTSRREYKSDFEGCIKAYRRELAIQREVASHEENQEPLKPLREMSEGDIKVCVRKRPIFKYEKESSEFDVITCQPEKQLITVHDARMESNMINMYINHHHLNFDEVFDDNATNEHVYQHTAAPLLQEAFDGKHTTCLMYGQTGSGKTYTMTSIYEQTAKDLFHNYCNRYGGRSGEDNEIRITCSFVEISGDNCSDLFNSFSPTQLLTGHDGGVYPYPVVEPEVSSAEELIQFIDFGCSVRSTAATGVNDTSSRSHAILRIFIMFPNSVDPSTGSFKEGVLTLVDLAGSEHRIDSMYHSAERRKECSAINSSLMALKEIMRAKATGSNKFAHFYRKSKLTMALKDSFALPDARTVMIATVSPASKDTEHSLSTLRHACLMIGKDGHNGKESESETENEDSATASSAKNNPDRISISNKRSISTNRTMVGNNTKGGKSSVYRGETRPGGIPRDLFRRPSSAPRAIPAINRTGLGGNQALDRQSSKDSNDSTQERGNKETRFLTGGRVVREDVGKIDVAFLSKRNRQLERDGYAVTTKVSNGNASKGKIAVNNGNVHAASSSTFGSALNENIREKEYTEEEKAKMRRQAEMRAIKELTVENRENLKNSRSRRGQDTFQQMRLRRNASSGSRLKPNSSLASPHINLERLDKAISRSSSYTSQIDSGEEYSNDVSPMASDNDMNDRDEKNSNEQDDDSLDDDVVPSPPSSTSVQPSSDRGQRADKNTDSRQDGHHGSYQASQGFESREKGALPQRSTEGSKSKAKINEQPSQKMSAQQRRERGEKVRMQERKDREGKLRSQSSSEIPPMRQSSSSVSSFVATQEQRATSAEAVNKSDGVAPSVEKKKLFLKLFKSTYSSDESTPEGIRLRQLAQLLKINKFSDAEITGMISAKLGEIALAKALATPVSEETMSTKETAPAPATSVASTRPHSSSSSISTTKPRPNAGIGPRGAPVRVIREREQIPEDHISPVSTLTQESSAAFSDEIASNRRSVGVVAINSLERNLKMSAGNFEEAPTRDNGASSRTSSSSLKGRNYEKPTVTAPSSHPMPTQPATTQPMSAANKEKAAAIFVKSSWVPRNEEEVGYLEDEIRRIDKEIVSSGGKMSKEGRKYEITRHGIIRRLQKYKAEQIRAARKTAAPPPPLPSEQQETAKVLTKEERKQLDKAAGWIKDRVNMEQELQMVDTNNDSNNNSKNSVYSNNAYSMHSRNQQEDQQQQQISATELFANRQIAINNRHGTTNNSNNYNGNTENDNSYNYDLRENLDVNTGASARDKNREAAMRLVQLSERVESMKRANAEFAAKQQETMNRKQQLDLQHQRPLDRITGAHIKRGVGNHKYDSKGGASSAPFANDLTWDKEMY